MEIHTIQVYPYRARACQCPCISTQSESMPWMQTTLAFCVRAGSRPCQCPWKSTHLCSAMDAMETHTIPVYPYRARVCQCPWTSTNLCSAMDAMEIHTIQAYPYRARVCQCPCISTQSVSMPWMQTTLVFCVRVGARLCQCPWKSTNLCSTMGAMEIHTIQVYPYRARVCQCPCISTQSVSMPWMQTTLVFCVRAGARLCQCPWKSTNLCSAMDAMEIHTIPVYPYRARVCQRPCISTQSDSVPCGCHGNPHYPGQGLPMPMDIHHGCHGNPHYPSLPFANAHGNPQIFAVPWMPWKSTLSPSTLIGLVPGFANMHIHKSFQLHYPSQPL